MSARLRPDRVGTLFMVDPDTRQYRAVRDPARPFAWRHPFVFERLVAVAKAGVKAWRIDTSGEFGPCI
jgi:hypothetical protein